jgi:hypothetical protein
LESRPSATFDQISLRASSTKYSVPRSTSSSFAATDRMELKSASASMEELISFDASTIVWRRSISSRAASEATMRWSDCVPAALAAKLRPELKRPLASSFSERATVQSNVISSPSHSSVSFSRPPPVSGPSCSTRVPARPIS